MGPERTGPDLAPGDSSGPSSCLRRRRATSVSEGPAPLVAGPWLPVPRAPPGLPLLRGDRLQCVDPLVCGDTLLGGNPPLLRGIPPLRGIPFSQGPRLCERPYFSEGPWPPSFLREVPFSDGSSTFPRALTSPRDLISVRATPQVLRKRGIPCLSRNPLLPQGTPLLSGYTPAPRGPSPSLL